MKKRLVSFLLCIIMVLGSSVTVSAEPDLTLDFNKRYTDISYFDEVNDPYLDLDKNSEAKQQKRNIYVVVLCVCLVAAIGVFIYTLRKVPSEDEMQAGSDKSLLMPKNKKEKTIKDEEKPL